MDTFNHLYDDFFKEEYVKKSRSKNTTDNVTYLYNRYLRNSIGLMLIKDVDIQDVYNILKEINSHAAAKLANLVKRTWQHGFFVGCTDGHKMNLLSTKFNSLPTKKHSAALIEKKEFFEFLRVINMSTSMTDEIKVSIFALAYTGQRVSDLLGMKWSQIDKDNMWYFTLSKSKRKHCVYLAKPLLKVLKKLPSYERRGPDGQDWVFVKPVKKVGPISRTHVSKVCRSFSRNRHTAHGFRASFLTLSRVLAPEISDMVRELILGHSSGYYLGETYARSRQTNQAKTDSIELMKRWGDFINDNVKIKLK